LEQLNPEYGAERRRLRIIKYRGVKFRGGFHDYTIQKGGLLVFPRLVAAEYRRAREHARLSSGNTALDTLLGGGIETGTSTLLMGAPGTGKSTLAAQFVHAAAKRGEKAAMFIFDESRGTLLSRSAGMGIDLAPFIESGQVTIQQIDPAELSPGEFAHEIRRAVEKLNTTVMAIDSLNGYLSAMPDERFLVIQLHEMLAYLREEGVATLFVAAQQGVVGTQMSSPVDASYLADAIILLRYFEAEGEIRQAISVVKKRGGAHERTIREFRLSNSRIEVGEPLREFRGVLTGVPSYAGSQSEQNGR
jgi:circadian clock protein KaiC